MPDIAGNRKLTPEGTSGMSLQFVRPYAKGTHERVAEYFLSEIAAGHGLHGEHCDALLVVHAAEDMAQTVVECGATVIRDNHYAPCLLTGTHCLDHIGEEVVAAYDVLHWQCRDGELAEIVLESLAVELTGKIARSEIFQTGMLTVVYEHHLHVVVSLTHSAVESHAVYPSRHVSLRYAPAYHALKIDYEIECHAVDIACIGYDDVLAPLHTVVCHVVHISKDNANERKESLLAISQVQLILCKDNANERKESLLAISRVQLILCKDKTNRAQNKINKRNSSIYFSYVDRAVFMPGR